MNRIVELSAVNIKVPSFKYQLEAVNILVGNNFVGKSAVLQAIQLGLLGYVPGGIPKTNAGIFSLSCGSLMSVTLRIADPTARPTDCTIITRSFEQRGESVKAAESITPKGFTVPNCLLDVGTYLNSSDRERVKFVFGLVDIGESWSGDRILRAIGETPIDCGPDMIEKVVLAKRAIFERMSESDHERHDADGTIQEWLESVLEDLRERVRNTTAALGRMEKYSQGAIELKAGDNMDAANVDRILRDKSADLKALGERLAVARSQQVTVRQNAATRQEIQRRLAEPFSAETVDATRKQIGELEPKVAGYKSAVGGLVGTLADASATVKTLKNGIEKAESDLRAAERQHGLDAKAPKCPHCGTSGKKFKEAVEEQFRERSAELRNQHNKLTEQLAEAQTACDAASNAYKAASEADKAATSDRLLLQSLRGELNRLETLAANRATWQRQLDGLETLVAPSQIEIGEMAKAVAVLSAEVDELGTRQKRWVAAAHEAKRAAEAREARAGSEAELCALKAVVKSVETIQAELVADAFGKILRDCNRFCADILLTPLAYRDGEIGRWSGLNWIPHRSFSGTEALLAGAAVSVALARQAPLKIVLLDECGRLQTKNKLALVNRLLNLTAEGFIDQCILVDVDAAPYRDIEGVQLIEI